MHAIQDLYSHSNYVELYREAYPDQTDFSKIPTLKEALHDDQYSKFAKILRSDLKTGQYDGDNPQTGANSHKVMNHDLGAGAQSSSKLVVSEVDNKSVDWFSQAAEAVATKASAEYLSETKTKAEK